MFSIVENEAQLAAVLGHEITHTIEKHTWRQMPYHKKERMALVMGGAVASGFGAYGIRDITTHGARDSKWLREITRKSSTPGGLTEYI
jgi:predicted Zn-dependent protease